MSITARRLRATVPGTYASLLVDVVARWDITPEQLLEGSGISPDQLLDLLWHLDEHIFARLLKRAILLTGEPGLGFHLGMQMKVSCHGLIGFTAMIAPNVREALEIAQQFVRIQSSTLTLRLEVEGDTACYYFEHLPDHQAFAAVIPVFLLLGFAMMGEAVTGKYLTGAADVQFARPKYFDRFEHLLPGHINFNQPHTRMIFPASYLDLPLIMADPSTARIAREECKRKLNQLLGSSQISHLVRDLIYDEVLGFSGMSDVAAKLYMSERTLQRQLDAEGQSFRAIVDSLRQQKAYILLKRRELTLEFIAEKLGYTDVNSFTRAFKRWTGMAPSKYRSVEIGPEAGQILPKS